MEIFSNKNEDVVISSTKIGYYHIFAISFSFIFIISNLAAIKIGYFFGVFLDTGTAYFPLLYIINDIVTEVYGFKASRRIIWLAIFANILFVFLLSIAVNLPSADGYFTNYAFNTLFVLSPRILVASISSFLIGEYINSVILSTSKISFKGKLFMFRAVISTFIGVTLESFLFATIAFYGVIPTMEIFYMTITLIFAKVLYGLVSVPISAKIVKFLKISENVDFYDYKTKFNIFSI